MVVQEAVAAARAAVWSWRREGAQLYIAAEPEGAFAVLDGVWTLESFLDQLEGLGRGPLERAFAQDEFRRTIDAEITLRDGLSARFIGAFFDEGAARGLIVSGDAHPPHDLARDEDVFAVYQPIRRLSDGDVAGFEALARWRTPDGRMVGPDDLAGLGRAADWNRVAPAMLNEAGRILRELRQAGRDIFMQVNLSAAEIGRPAIVQSAADVLEALDLPAGVLRVELTEHAALRDYERALGALAALEAAGAGLVLDDFGAGHSSLAWLAQIPARGVKIDPKLIRLAGQPRGDMILRAMTKLARDLGLEVTAEGVEDAAQAEFLAEIGCDYVQGYAYGRPVQADALSDLLAGPNNAGHPGDVRA